MKQLITSFVAGVLFAIGLGVAGMTQPQKVVGFLDFAGRWDASLAFVMMGAIGVHAVLFRLILRRSSPLLGGTFALPTQSSVDRRLVLGAAIFGVGWGLGGVCPGPGLVSVASGASTMLLFVGAMVAGMGLHSLIDTLRRPALSASATPDAT